MKVVEWNEHKSWNNFVASQKRSQFLESWEWGTLQEQEGRKVYRLALVADNEDRIEGVFILVRMPLFKKYGYFYTPRGPIFLTEDKDRWSMIVHKIEELAKKDNAVFWRFEPLEDLPGDIAVKIKEVLSIQPKNTLILDLKDSEEELLKKMHSKTRYNIKVAQKKEVKVKMISAIEEKDIEIFWNLLKETAGRDSFGLHDREHYKRLAYSAIEPKLYFAIWQEKAIAANLTLSFGDMSTYLHGASSSEFRNVMPAYLLQWEAVKEAKRRGYRYYDFWGINKLSADQRSDNDYKPDWEGITRFKKRFGGQEMNYPGTYELPLNTAMYGLYRMYKKLK